MSVTGVNIGWGARLRIGRGLPAVFTALVGHGDFDFPQAQAEDIDVTSHSSPNRTKEFIPGIIDNGEISVPIDYIPNNEQDQLLRYLQQTGELIQIEITPGGVSTPEIYAGYVRQYTRSAPVQGKSTATLVFRINGIVSGQATDPGAGG